jgi:hypothetical protein
MEVDGFLQQHRPEPPCLETLGVFFLYRTKSYIVFTLLLNWHLPPGTPGPYGCEIASRRVAIGSALLLEKIKRPVHNLTSQAKSSYLGPLY